VAGGVAGVLGGQQRRQLGGRDRHQRCHRRSDPGPRGHDRTLGGRRTGSAAAVLVDAQGVGQLGGVVGRQRVAEGRGSRRRPAEVGGQLLPAGGGDRGGGLPEAGRPW
jgi:hypothetical protein